MCVILSKESFAANNDASDGDLSSGFVKRKIVWKDEFDDSGAYFEAESLSFARPMLGRSAHFDGAETDPFGRGKSKRGEEFDLGRHKAFVGHDLDGGDVIDAIQLHGKEKRKANALHRAPARRQRVASQHIFRRIRRVGRRRFQHSNRDRRVLNSFFVSRRHFLE